MYGYNTFTDTDGKSFTNSEIVTYTSKVGNTTNTYTYTYDNRGNITSLTLNGVLQYTYSYDSLGQMYSYEDHINNVSYYYEYDESGNILFYEEYDTEYEYTVYQYWNEYDGDRLIAQDNTRITYDEFGRTSNYFYRPITYYANDYSKIQSIGDATFTYNADGLRRTKTVDGVTHYYTYDGIKLIKEEWSNNVVLYLYDADGSPVGMQYRNSTYASGTWDTYLFERNLQVMGS